MAARIEDSEMTDSMVNIGPCVVPTYSLRSFSRFPRDIEMYAVWKLVGPTVQKNIGHPLWLQFCAVYLEGLNHGSEAVRTSEQAAKVNASE